MISFLLNPKRGLGVSVCFVSSWFPEIEELGGFFFFLCGVKDSWLKRPFNEVLNTFFFFRSLHGAGRVQILINIKRYQEGWI